MAESGSREPASDISALKNLRKILHDGTPVSGVGASHSASQKLREELAAKGLKGFKRGGKVKKTGLAKVHKGERVLTAKQAKAHKAHKPVARKAAARPRGRR